jgi:hypothetical protein
VTQRKDAKFTTKGKRASVRVPNASTIGTGKWMASPGDFIVFRIPDDDMERYARVIGRVDAEGWDGADKTPIVGEIACVMLSCGLSSAHEMWVDPEWVMECHSVGPHNVRFFTAFFTADPMDLLAMSEYGSLAAHEWSTCQLPTRSDRSAEDE